MANQYLKINGQLAMLNGKLIKVPEDENLNDLADEQAVLATLNLETSEEIEDLIVNGVIDGSPRGAYATLTALRTAYPNGTYGVYLTLNDGHWYYWNGTEWKDGGIYQAVSNAIINLGVLNENPASETNSILNLFTTPGIFTFTYQNMSYLFIVSEVEQGVISQTLIYTLDYYVSDYYRLMKFTRIVDFNQDHNDAGEITVSVSTPTELCTTEYVDKKISSAITGALTKEY